MNNNNCTRPFRCGGVHNESGAPKFTAAIF